MAEINSFLCYRSYIDAVKVLSTDKRWDFFEKVSAYALDGTPPDFSETIEIAMFKLMKANLDSCGKRYIANVENGKKGGAPNGNCNAKKQPKKQPKTTQQTTQNNLNKDDNDNVDDNYHYHPTDEGALSAPPPSGTKNEERFEMCGKLYEYYIAENGERRARPV